jgi:hypothetical protein
MMRTFACISPRAKASFGESVPHHAERPPHDIDIVPAIRVFADPVRADDAIGVPKQTSGDAAPSAPTPFGGERECC